MPYATHQDVRIHYQVEGAGPPLVLLHGFNSSLERWYESGYVESLRHAKIFGAEISQTFTTSS